MNITVVCKQIQAQSVDAIVVNLCEDVSLNSGASAAVDTALGSSDGIPGSGALSRIIALGDFRGRLNEVALIYGNGLIPATRVIVVGLGKRESLSAERVRQASATAIRKARDLGCKRVASVVHGAGTGGMDPRIAARATVEGTLAGAYQFRDHRSKSDDTQRIAEMLLVEQDRNKIDAIKSGAREGEIIAGAINTARRWVNLAPNALNPQVLADEARKEAQRIGLSCDVLGEAEIRQLGMGALLAVSQGSVNPPRFVVLDTAPDSGTEPDLLLIGKGVTFDSGGYSIKTAEGMLSMKGDMAGAAAVIAATLALHELKAPRRIVALAPMVENMISGGATRPGDVITTMAGITVEIVNTDAEGRLILADAIHYAKRFRPRAIVDIATLTGVSATAMGEGMAASLISNNDGLCARLLSASESSGERMWRMPLYAEYGDKIKSDYADIKNTGGSKGGLGASAYFLKRFIDHSAAGEATAAPAWAHIDMAGMAFASDTRGTHVRGASGFGVRALIELGLIREQ